MPDQQLDRQAAQQRASEWLGRRKPAASASLKADEFAATVLAYEAALAAAEQERDERISASTADEWLSHRFNETWERLQAAERRAVRAEEQLRALSEALWDFDKEAILSIIRPGEIARWKQRFFLLRVEADRLFRAAASVAGGGQAVEPAAEDETA